MKTERPKPKPSPNPAENVTFPLVVKEGNAAVRIYRTRSTKSGKEGPKQYVSFMMADHTSGRRKLRPFADFEAARKEAKRIAGSLVRGEKTAAGLTNTQAASYGRAVELLQPTGAALEIACGRYAEALKLLRGDRIIEAAKFFLEKNPDQLTPRTVEQVVEEMLASKKGKGRSDRHLQDLRSRLSRFAESFQVQIASINGPDIQRWLDGLGLSQQSVKNFRTVLHVLFNYAQRRGYVLRGENPVSLTERVEVKDGTIEIYTPAEVASLLAAAAPDFLPCLAVQAFAGLRSAEVERLTWEDVDMASGHIKLSAGQSKTASRRLVPISENLRAWLVPYAGQTGKVWQSSERAFHLAQQETAAKAGVEWKQNAPRHSFISYRVAQTQNAAQVAMEAGNSAAVVFKHYRELVTAQQAATWFSVRPEAPANLITVSPAAAAK